MSVVLSWEHFEPGESLHHGAVVGSVGTGEEPLEQASLSPRDPGVLMVEKAAKLRWEPADAAWRRRSPRVETSESKSEEQVESRAGEPAEVFPSRWRGERKTRRQPT